MNFEFKSTFKSKCKRFWIISENRVTKHVLLADEFTLYRLLVGHLFFKYDEMRSRWDFTVTTAVILLKGISEFVFNRARSTLYSARWRMF